jgi:hypothetical protein
MAYQAQHAIARHECELCQCCLLYYVEIHLKDKLINIRIFLQNGFQHNMRGNMGRAHVTWRAIA